MVKGKKERLITTIGQSNKKLYDCNLQTSIQHTYLQLTMMNNKIPEN